MSNTKTAAPAKKAAAPKLKVGQPVKATSATGNVTLGRYHSSYEVTRCDGRPGGSMINVNIAEKGKPAVLKTFRPKAVVPA